MSFPREVEELVASLMRRIEALEAENGELRRRLDLDSSNSSKPPSSDGLKKKPRVLSSLRKRTGKRSGGQKGHRGDTLRQVAEPDRIVEHAAERCAHCRARLLAGSKIGDGEAPGFRSSGEAADRDRAPRGGPRLPGLRPTHAGRLPRRRGFADPVWRARQGGGRLSQRSATRARRTNRAGLARPVRGSAACGASVAGWVRRKAEALAPVYRAIGECVAAAPVRCLDETGFRIAGTTRWLHTASTPTHTFYRADEPRSAVPELQGGVVVHDHWRAYYEPRNRRSRLLQRPSPARASGGQRTRQGALGRGPARDASGRQRGRANGQSAGRPRRFRPKRSRRSKTGIGPPSEKASPFTGACRPSIPR